MDPSKLIFSPRPIDALVALAASSATKLEPDAPGVCLFALDAADAQEASFESRKPLVDLQRHKS